MLSRKVMEALNTTELCQLTECKAHSKLTQERLPARASPAPRNRSFGRPAFLQVSRASSRKERSYVPVPRHTSAEMAELTSWPAFPGSATNTRYPHKCSEPGPASVAAPSSPALGSTQALPSAWSPPALNDCHSPPMTQVKS